MTEKIPTTYKDHKKEIGIAILIVLLVLFFDQYLKIWVKTNMRLGDQIPVAGNWFYLHFIENPGMAFGWKFWGETGKILLTSFRIVAAIGISIYVLRFIKRGIPKLSLVFFSLILAGAIGNIIDSVFYGQLFTQSYPGQLAEYANGSPYASYFKGSVVDMLYFPLINTYWPEWMPFVGGESLEFFRPVFNIADAAITAGVIGMLVFQRSVFSKDTEEIVTEAVGEAEYDDSNDSESTSEENSGNESSESVDQHQEDSSETDEISK